MTTRKRAAAAAAYKPAAYYWVQLNRPVEIPGGHLLPTKRHRIKGSFLDTLDQDAVTEAVEFVPSADQVEG